LIEVALDICTLNHRTSYCSVKEGRQRPMYGPVIYLKESQPGLPLPGVHAALP
jgi:hypothetical protein